MDERSPGPHAFFTDDHRACDALWAELEGALNANEDARARELWPKFDEAMRRHFDMEEEVLFPALEQVTRMPGMGPTQVMRREHAQMRAVLDQMADDVQAGNLEGVLDHGDTLLMLVQQHNVKEESMLYPMAEQALSGHWDAITKQLAKY
jgi:hemerythrin-like domain-containing protein